MATGDIRRLIGLIKVTESDQVIEITGLPVKTLNTDIFSIWRTSRIAKWMFIETTRSGVKIPSYFALEFSYALTRILEQPKRQTNKRALKRLLRLLFSETWLVKTQEPVESKLDWGELRWLNKTPLEHQVNFLKAYDQYTQQFNLNGYILAGAPGSGKTITGLALGLMLKADPAIIVCPKEAVYEVWLKSIENEISARGITTYVADRDRDQVPTDAQYYIFHYEALGRAVDISRQLKGRKPFIILDESHNLNLSVKLSGRSANYIELCDNLGVEETLWASGTPLKAMGEETVVFSRTSDPLFTNDVEQRFLKIFGRSSERANDILKHRLGQVTFKIPKSQFRKDRPTWRELWVEIPNAKDYTLDAVRRKMQAFVKQRLAYYEDNRQSYVDAFESIMATYEQTLKAQADIEAYKVYRGHVKTIASGYDPATMNEIVKSTRQYEEKQIIPTLSSDDKKRLRDVRSVVKYPKLKVQGECLGQIVGGMRVTCHVDMARHVDLTDTIDGSEKKSLIFSSYVEVVNQLETRLRDQGYRPLTVHSRNGLKLNDQIQKFQRVLDANPLITTYDSLSTAVPITEANTVVMFNAPFRDYVYEQAYSRSDRIGQDVEVFVVDVYLDTGQEPNISTRSKDILEWSRQQVNTILDMEGDTTPLPSLEAWTDESFYWDTVEPATINKRQSYGISYNW